MGIYEVESKKIHLNRGKYDKKKKFPFSADSGCCKFDEDESVDIHSSGYLVGQLGRARGEREKKIVGLYHKAF
jgi:hypothetical protein